MIVSAIESLGGWTWWILGLVLLGVEILAPGFFFLWFGVAALIIGVSAVTISWPWQLQILGFAVLSVVAALAGRRFFGYRDAPSSDPHLNLRTARLHGRTFTLTEPIAEGSGRIRIDDSVWRVSGPDTPAGTRIRIVGADGALLLVEPEVPLSHD
ncbi:membrane protein implicated in regulation of membrane protease activity [Rhodopseudomonas julia]|uniref:Membrane protein implicated in regulation of membrane protease activity n=1 Tax=Rhodopseudomonas julia TaxID=200617 RepID=A0ABU0C524_9BRAD|nr:NfeD family protein [Rhodopseudomonas julia]MDQ0325619.1 membrane protein implicated in regulation of membrane protease activity [Rhodopseudomonas julia]